MKSFFSSLSWLIGSFANFYFILRWFSDDRFLLVRLCNYLLPWLGVLVAVTLILSALNKRWILSALNISPMAVLLFIYAPLFLNCTCDAPPENRNLKVMSYNIRQFNRNMPAAAAIIRREMPDVLLLQEIEPPYFQLLISMLKNLYADEPLQVAYHPNIMQAVLSRYPLGEIYSSTFKNRLQKVVVDTPYGPITVLNIHSYKFGWQDRHQRMGILLKEDVVPEKGPLILGGDFNTNDQSQTYHLVKGYLRDAHWQVGCGLGFSYPARLFFFSNTFPTPAMIRIDHIFHSNHLTPIKAYTLDDSGGSDHYPIVAEFRFLH
jgi:endonuclease/exonuclease/phosphatase (EEP) superfamily protein YafD